MSKSCVTHGRSGIAAGHRRATLVACCILLCWSLPPVCAAAQQEARVRVRTLKNGHFQLMVGRKPFVVKGVCYSPIPVGKNHQYDWWTDPNKPWLVDGRLMKSMGINTVRIYQPGDNPEAVRQVIRDLYERYGIHTILGHWLGFWEYPYPFYGDPAFRERVKQEVLAMVAAYKDEPGVLLWILGNENNYSFGGRVNPWSTDDIDAEADPQKQMTARARIYYSFVEDITRAIHDLDPDHPVALGNGELIALDIAREAAPSVDLVACIIYRGKTFGNLFNSLRVTFDKPVLLSEFGSDGYDAYQDKEDQNMQAFFLESQWRQIYSNLANVRDGIGNCLGGVMFEWNDEWWKHNEHDPEGWLVHDTASNWSNGSYYFDIKAPNNKNMNEEWFGIVGMSEELDNGLNRRSLKKAYYVIREFWKNPVLKVKSAKGKVKR